MYWLKIRTASHMTLINLSNTWDIMAVCSLYSMRVMNSNIDKI